MMQATVLVGQFKRFGTPDKIFLASVAKVFEAYSQDAVQQVLDPLDGLASDYDDLPSIKQIIEALEAASPPKHVALPAPKSEDDRYYPSGGGLSETEARRVFGDKVVDEYWRRKSAGITPWWPREELN
jgi:hypothetical protein